MGTDRKAYMDAWRKAHREEQRAYFKALNATPERRAYMKAYDKARQATPERKAQKALWTARNREKVAASRARYYAKSREKVLADNARWRAENPDRVQFLNSMSYARRRLAEHGLL